MFKKILLISIVSLSCTEQKDFTEKKYFDLKGFSENLIADLQKVKPEVKKTWQLDAKAETKSNKDIDWQKELALFVDADLNKKAYLNSYETRNSGLETLFSLKNGEELPVKLLSIQKDSAGKVEKISIERSTSNYLFKTNSKFEMKLEKEKLTNYKIQTIQELFLTKPDTSIIIGQIIKSL
ncbi:hypothetical protein EGI22_23330 [Lacihabitans sp. LS3-19]|uniref:hypothetical protein n=1 Tax=Lacihabitans sp. LS3-19 TaxID=2487335 RepID=UPI0020CD0962|nr:hypothetical protein [Lacihabitans sp. LS3-19]MCP9770847.1 hypothetical protein [Lacihabitans sp. LS3-19]